MAELPIRGSGISAAALPRWLCMNMWSRPEGELRPPVKDWKEMQWLPGETVVKLDREPLIMLLGF